MKYNVKKMPALNWDMAEKAEISNYVWGKKYTPRAWAKLICVKDSLFLRMECEEENPRAEYGDFFDPVYRDSCLEFFFSFEKGGKYINCEMNSRGAALIAVGEGRNGRVRIDEITSPPAVKASWEEKVWRVDVEFGLAFLKTVLGEKVSLDAETIFYGNFYKCGDDTEIPHYGMWNPVITETPDFHRPEHFGELFITGK